VLDEIVEGLEDSVKELVMGKTPKKRLPWERKQSVV
jgi:hypothetical protein